MRLQTLATAVICCCVSLSCNKSDPPPIITTPVSSFSARVDGKVFSTTDIQGYSSTSALAITATTNAGTGKATAISLSLFHYRGLGTYSIDTATLAQYTEYSAVFRGTSGAVVISTENDVHVSGSFSFEATDTATKASKSITAGSFDVYK